MEVPLRLRWSGYASLSETNGHIMTQVRWLMTIPASSLAFLLYHTVPHCIPYFCLLIPVNSIYRYFIAMKYTFLSILHITRDEEPCSIFKHHSIIQPKHIAQLHSKLIVIADNSPLPFLLKAMCSDSEEHTFYYLYYFISWHPLPDSQLLSEFNTKQSHLKSPLPQCK